MLHVNRKVILIGSTLDMTRANQFRIKTRICLTKGSISFNLVYAQYKIPIGMSTCEHTIPTSQCSCKAVSVLPISCNYQGTRKERFV